MTLLSHHFKIALITAAHGIRGEVKLLCFLENPKDIMHYLPLLDKNGNHYNIIIKGRQKDQLIVALENITDRNQADLLRGTELYADKNKLPTKEEDEFFVSELIGLNVLLEDGSGYGTVIDLHNFGAGDILEIKKTDGETAMFAFNDQTISKLDIESGNITLTPPEEI